MAGLAKFLLHVVLPGDAVSSPDLAELSASLAPYLKPETESYLLEFDTRAARDEYRGQLLERGVLCAPAPIPARARGRWQGFLAGGSPLGFNFWALIFSPLWILFSGLSQKFFLWLGLFVGLSGLASIASGPPLGAAAQGLAALGSLALWLYPCLFGDHDLYLSRVRGEALWRSLPYARYKLLAWAVASAGLLGGVALKTEVKVPGTHEWTLPVGGKETVLATLQMEAKAPLALAGGAARTVKDWALMWEKTPRRVVDRLDLGDGRAVALPPLGAQQPGAAPLLSCLGDMSVSVGNETRLAVAFGPARLKTTLQGWRRACFLADAAAGGEPRPVAVAWVPRAGVEQGPYLDQMTAASRTLLGLPDGGGSELFIRRSASTGPVKTTLRRYLVLPAGGDAYIIGDYYTFETPSGPPAVLGLLYPQASGDYIDARLVPAVAAALSGSSP